MNTETHPVKLVRYDAAGTLRQADAIKEVYLAAHLAQQDNPWYSPAKFWERLEQLYAPIPDFELVTGWLDDRMIGYAFGTPYRRAQEVRDKAVHVFPDEPATGPVYIFREFAIHPDNQGKGYGKTIHEALLADRPETLAYLLVRIGNPARALYESWGWHFIGRDQPFTDSPVMEEMAKQLPIESLGHRASTGTGESP